MIKGEYIIKLEEAPENCFECLFIREEVDMCIFTREWVDDNGTIPECCPIINVNKEKNNDRTNDSESN